MDSTAIKQIQESAHIPEVLKHLKEVKTDVPVAFVPSNFKMNNIEEYQEFLSRYRMSFATTSIKDFVLYGHKFSEEGATCFVCQELMQADTIFDLGTVDKPLHKEHTAKLFLEKLAAFKALLNVNQEHLSQKQVANFIEDWGDLIQAYDRFDKEMTPGQAANAIRNLTIETARSLSVTVEDFSESMSDLEKIEAKSSSALPGMIHFTCEPYKDLSERVFSLRVSVLTSGEKPTIGLRIVRLEQQLEAIAEEFKSLLENGLKKTQVTVYMGKYK